MNYKVWTPCEKRYPGCYGDKPRVYAKKEDAEARCQELNERPVPMVPCPKCNGAFENCNHCGRKGQVPGPEIELVGTFSFVATNLPVD